MLLGNASFCISSVSCSLSQALGCQPSLGSQIVCIHGIVSTPEGAGC